MLDERGQNVLTLPADTYNVTETLVVSGYTPSYDNCSNVVLDPGETEICTITNTAAITSSRLGVSTSVPMVLLKVAEQPLASVTVTA